MVDCLFQREKVDVGEEIPLHILLEHCRSFLGKDSNLAVVNENLFNIPLNQWRNIAAHKSYKCLGGKVNARLWENSRKRCHAFWG